MAGRQVLVVSNVKEKRKMGWVVRESVGLNFCCRKKKRGVRWLDGGG